MVNYPVKLNRTLSFRFGTTPVLGRRFISGWRRWGCERSGAIFRGGMSRRLWVGPALRRSEAGRRFFLKTGNRRVRLKFPAGRIWAPGRGCCGVSLILAVCRFWGGLAHRRDFPGGGNFPDSEKRRRLRAEIGGSVVAAVRHYLRRRGAWRQRAGLFRNLRRDGFGAAARDAGVCGGGGFMECGRVSGLCAAFALLRLRPGFGGGDLGADCLG